MPHRWWIWLVLVVASGAIMGAVIAPRYRPPDSGDQARLRERAVAFYRAGRLLDFWTMARSFTPARQIAEAADLSAMARKRDQTRRSFQKETIKDLEQAAASIKPDTIQVELEGAWAVTQGDCILYADGVAVPGRLEPLVWVRNAGEWWVYTKTKAELNAYGNPPDFALKYLDQNKSGNQVIQMPEPAPAGAGPEPGGAPAPASPKSEGGA